MSEYLRTRTTRHLHKLLNEYKQGSQGWHEVMEELEKRHALIDTEPEPTTEEVP